MPVKPLFFLLLLISVLFWPWWLSLALFLIAQYKWPPFYPALPLGLLYDLLYFPRHWSPAFLIVAAILLLWPWLRRYIRL